MAKRRDFVNHKWRCFGQALEKGIDFYNRKMYADAKEFFQEAFSINCDDFVINFWLMRVAIMTHDYTGAREYLSKCIQIEPKLKDLLIDPWYKVLNDSMQGKESEELETLNQRTNELLDYCHRNKEFSIYTFVGIVGFYFLSSSIYEFTLDILQLQFHIQMTIHLISYIYLFKFLFFLLPVAFYYNYKSLCTPNLWIELCRVKRCFNELCRNNSFKVVALSYCVIIMFPEVFSFFYPEFSGEAAKGFLSRYSGYPVPNYLGNLLMAPVLEEILFRGILFNYIKKYNKSLAYLVVSFLFYCYHGEFASGEHFIKSMIYCWLYDKYGTMVAPIVVHFLNNFLFIITLWIELLR